MNNAKCPVCGNEDFYVKNPDDEYDIYEFECQDGEIRFKDTSDGNDCPEIGDATETFCNTCAWHGKFGKLK